jgi:hypothetical protein
MNAAMRTGLGLAFVLCAAGCATPQATAPSAVVTSQRAKVIAPQRTKNAVTVGKSTKGDVLAALGETLAIDFDNGYEVWVYHLADTTRARRSWGRPDPGATGEYVVLFAPSGIAAKTRLRPAPGSRSLE